MEAFLGGGLPGCVGPTEAKEEVAGVFAFCGRGLPPTFDSCGTIGGGVGTTGSGGGVGDKDEEDDRGLLFLQSNKHWSSEDDRDNAHDEESVVHADPMFESVSKVEKEDSDNGDGPASLKRPVMRGQVAHGAPPQKLAQVVHTP